MGSSKTKYVIVGTGGRHEMYRDALVGTAQAALGDRVDARTYNNQILPRLSRPAGFEVGTGFTINSVMPETAARRLRAKG